MLKPAVLNESSKIPADKKMEKKQKQKPRKITQNNDPFKKKKRMKPLDMQHIIAIINLHNSISLHLVCSR